MAGDSDKCDCKGTKKEKKSGGCPEKSKDEGNKCCGSSSKKQDKSPCSGASAGGKSQKNEQCSGKSDKVKSKGDGNKCCESSSKKQETSSCSGASACAQSQKKEQCSGKSEKFKCPQTSKKGKCHSSHEEFKKGQDKCSSAGDEKRSSAREGKCSESYKAFLDGREDSACPRKDGKCHESHSTFFSKKDSDKGPCSAMAAPKQQEDCPSSMKSQSESPCSAAQQKDPCGSSSKTSSLQKPCNPEKQETSCYSSNKKPTQPEKPCGFQTQDLKEASAYAKISGFCKNLAKQYVSPKPKSKCSGDESLSKQICPKKPSGLPPSKPPCPPMTEIGMPPRVGVDCTSKVTCPQMKKTDLSSFFPLDARNKELNDCIEKWTKVDPNQVIGKCSQFADKPGGTLCQKCLEADRRTLHCPRPPRRGMPKRPSLTIPVKTRQLAARWTPSAIGYLATSALLTVYITEWKAILRHVPFYSEIAQEEAPP